MVIEYFCCFQEALLNSLALQMLPNKCRLKASESEDVEANSSNNSCKNLIASSFLYMWGQGISWLVKIGCVISGM